MAAVKISELEKFTLYDLADVSNLLIPASKGSDITKTINVKDLVDHVVSNSTHEQEQETKLSEHDSELESHTNTLQSHTNELQEHNNTLQTHTSELKIHETKISNVENIDVWDLTTFH
jgi:hypothetical protein